MTNEVEKLAIKVKKRHQQSWFYIAGIIAGTVISVVIGFTTRFFYGVIAFVVTVIFNIALYIILRNIAERELKVIVNVQAGYWKYQAIQETLDQIGTSTPVPIEKITAFANDQFLRNMKSYYPSLNTEGIVIIPNDTFVALQDLLAKNPNLGSYHHVEQLFVKKIEKSERQSISTQVLSCFYCGNPIEAAHRFCRSCRKEILKCSVCKLPIVFGSETGSCSLCESVAHLPHLLEWVKTQGKCPSCLQELTEEGVFPLSVDVKK